MYRFAPSPTGDMHVGNLRVALINFILAKQEKKQFILRIEDTDQARNIKGKEEEIQNTLKLFGISWDQFYIQSKNLSFHRQMALRLVEEKKAFCCYCSKEELEVKKTKAKQNNTIYRYDNTCKDKQIQDKAFSIRLFEPQQGFVLNDKIKGEIKFEANSMDSFVILREDKTPTYNFACAIDDMLEDISFIIRGEDHVSNTPKQEHIRRCLNYTKEISYAHLPVILNENSQKMSKREAHSSVKYLLEEGILASAISNYLLLLGNKTPCEVFSLDEAISWFDLKNISKSPAKFDYKKLLQLNREHIKKMPNQDLNSYLNLDKDLANLAKFYTQEASTLKEIKEKLSLMFSYKDFKEYEKECLILKNLLKDIPNFSTYDEFKAYLLEKSQLKAKNFFKPLRLVLTGLEHGPDLSDLYDYIKDYLHVLARI